jgi:peptide/nickel transport system ATP-binding protein
MTTHMTDAPSTQSSTTMTQEKPFIDIRDLTVTFTGGRKPVRAVSGVSLSVKRGEVVALIGESGSGKSVTLRSILRLHNEDKSKLEGQIVVGDQDVVTLSNADLSAFRGKVASMIFQEPLLALDPVYSVGEQIIEAILRHENIGKEAARARALSLFERVRIPSPERRLDAYPHEMSGGMRQRAMISLALASHPQLLLADEPTTALDATVQIQILLLLRELQRELGLSVIFVTHDIGAAVEVADRIAVMYAGRIVEEGTTRTLMRTPRHPYTRALLKSLAHGNVAKGTRLETIPGSPPDLSNLPPGCVFADRCSLALDSCRESIPEIVMITPDHSARCHRTDQTAIAV